MLTVKLNVSVDVLSNEQKQEIYRWLSSMNGLQCIDMSGCVINADFIDALSVYLFATKTLRKLVIRHCMINSFNRLVTAVSGCSTLRQIDLTACGLNDDHVNGILTLVKCRTLIDINLSQNWLKDKDVQQIGNALIKNRTLRRLNLFDNPCDAVIMIDIMRYNRGLISLNIGHTIHGNWNTPGNHELKLIREDEVITQLNMFTQMNLVTLQIARKFLYVWKPDVDFIYDGKNK
jgi:hypothetical protein